MGTMAGRLGPNADAGLCDLSFRYQSNPAPQAFYKKQAFNIKLPASILQST